MRSLAIVIGALTMVCAQQQELPPDAVIQVALQTASDYLGVPTDDLVLVMAAQRDWPDSAIGCPQEGGAYAQVITPGYVVTIDTADLVSEVQVHTDMGSRGAIC